MIGQHAGDLRFKEPRTVMPGPKEINTSKSGYMPKSGYAYYNYNEGKGALDLVIKSEGRDMIAASHAGSRINDTIQNMVTLKKLVSCKD